MGEGCNVVGEEHDTATADEDIEPAVGERVHLRVALLEGDVVKTFRGRITAGA
ncbi:hypothetical protein GCM10015535_41610 [Streptomyces gelaticus]|uniref:Uncharacterized protein n=1 Tax=Streptomyces gelaticus TaxID=285446 RepID=A0ABQ2W274_9ACTN|nr:hypothetical protein GCM10015535_41610 [Streptomyces gelaticus]